MPLNDLNMGKFNALFARIFVRETHKPPEREVIEKSNTKGVDFVIKRKCNNYVNIAQEFGMKEV